MNEMELLRSFGGIKDKYILEADEVKRKKMNKRIVGILIAAALILMCAIGAGAYFADRTGLLNGLKWYFSDTDDLTDGEIRALDEVISYKGKFNENTFTDVDVTFAGAMYADNAYTAVFTLRRTDGTPFTAPKGYVWRTGFTDVGLDLFFIDRTQKSYTVTPQCFINDDGSLSVSVHSNGFYQPQFKKYIVGFTGLYCVPEDYACEESTKRQELAEAAVSAYQSADKEQNKLYEQKCDEYFAYSEEISSDYVTGEIRFLIDLSDLPDSTLHLETELDGETVSVRLTPISIDLETVGTDGTRYKENDSLPVTIVYNDGSSFGAKRTYFMSDPGRWSMGFYPDRPIDMAQVDHIMLGDTEMYIE